MTDVAMPNSLMLHVLQCLADHPETLRSFSTTLLDRLESVIGFELCDRAIGTEYEQD